MDTAVHVTATQGHLLASEYVIAMRARLGGGGCPPIAIFAVATRREAIYRLCGPERTAASLARMLTVLTAGF